MKKKYIWRLILAFYVLFIFSNSMKPAVVSSQDSKGVLSLLQTLFLSLGLPAGMLTDHLVRKAAHFTEYTLLGLLLGKNSGEMEWKPVTKGLAAVIAGFLIPFLDETIQLFTAGRSGQISDVWLDMSGAFAGLLIWLVAVRIGKKQGDKRNHEKL